MPETNLAWTKFRQENRRRQNLEAKQRQRARLKEEGARVLTIELTGATAAEIAELRELQRGPLEGFYLRALITGARFLANAGAPRGRKVKTNGGIAEKGVTIADKSARRREDEQGQRPTPDIRGPVRLLGSSLPPCSESIHGKAA